MFDNCSCMPSCFTCVWLFVTQWTVAHQAPLSVGFSRQGWWSGWSCSPPGGSSWPRDQTHVSYIFCSGRQVLYHYHHQISYIHTISFCHISMSYVLPCLLVCVFDCAYMFLSVFNPLILRCDGRRLCALIRLNLSLFSCDFFPIILSNESLPGLWKPTRSVMMAITLGFQGLLLLFFWMCIPFVFS